VRRRVDGDALHDAIDALVARGGRGGRDRQRADHD
jgi:hypothetical protein